MNNNDNWRIWKSGYSGTSALPSDQSLFLFFYYTNVIPSLLKLYKTKLTKQNPKPTALVLRNLLSLYNCVWFREFVRTMSLNKKPGRHLEKTHSFSEIVIYSKQIYNLTNIPLSSEKND